MELKSLVKEDRFDSFYKLVPDPDNIDGDYWCLEIQEGKFKGIIYKYGNIGISKPEEVVEDDMVKAKFEYDIIRIPDELKDVVFGDEVKLEFETLLGDIMIEMIQDDLKIKEEKEEGDDSDGDDDSEKFTVRRTVRTEGNPFFKE